MTEPITTDGIMDSFAEMNTGSSNDERERVAQIESLMQQMTAWDKSQLFQRLTNEAKLNNPFLSPLTFQTEIKQEVKVNPPKPYDGLMEEPQRTLLAKSFLTDAQLFFSTTNLTEADKKILFVNWLSGFAKSWAIERFGTLTLEGLLAAFRDEFMPENTVLASIELLRLIIQRTDTVVEYAKKFRRQATLVNGAISDEILAGFFITGLRRETKIHLITRGITSLHAAINEAIKYDKIRFTNGEKNPFRKNEEKDKKDFSKDH